MFDQPPLLETVGTASLIFFFTCLVPGCVFVRFCFLSQNFLQAKQKEQCLMKSSKQKPSGPSPSAQSPNKRTTLKFRAWTCCKQLHAWHGFAEAWSALCSRVPIAGCFDWQGPQGQAESKDLGLYLFLPDLKSGDWRSAILRK